jgi:outer membrane lipoprotein-sorting protein
MSEEDAVDNGYITNDAELFTQITNEVSEDMTARVDTLDGQEVIYVETTEADGDMGEALVKMWYSVKYAMPLKYEYIVDGELTRSYKVVSIEKNIKIDKDSFTPPAGVNFVELNMDEMEEMYEDMEEMYEDME